MHFINSVADESLVYYFIRKRYEMRYRIACINAVILVSKGFRVED